MAVAGTMGQRAQRAATGNCGAVQPACDHGNARKIVALGEPGSSRSFALLRANYYFSAKPLEDHEYFHVTSFRGRPEQPVRDLVLQGDIALRQAVRTVFKEGIVENKHVYKKD
jgi:hypothetical protein